MLRAPYTSAPSLRFARISNGLSLGVWLALTVTLALSVGLTNPASAQNWGESDDNGSSDSSPAPETGGASTWDKPASSNWSFRAGAGFTIDPNTFLMNFELPYRFDQYVSAGPMMQVGIKDNKLIIAPTANLTITIPDLPGEDFDRFHPNLFAGIGFAVIEDDDRSGDETSAGFLINAGVGLDYQLSQRVTVGSRMIFNFLPERTLEEKFWYSWEVVGVRLSF